MLPDPANCSRCSCSLVHPIMTMNCSLSNIKSTSQQALSRTRVASCLVFHMVSHFGDFFYLPSSKGQLFVPYAEAKGQIRLLPAQLPAQLWGLWGGTVNKSFWHRLEMSIRHFSFIFSLSLLIRQVQGATGIKLELMWHWSSCTLWQVRMVGYGISLGN